MTIFRKEGKKVCFLRAKLELMCYNYDYLAT